jgi:hypothetical protein
MSSPLDPPLLDGAPRGAPDGASDGAPSGTLADIAAEVEQARARVAASLNTLGEEVARRGDWRAWVRARPALVIAGALALGFVFGSDRS